MQLPIFSLSVCTQFLAITFTNCKLVVLFEKMLYGKYVVEIDSGLYLRLECSVNENRDTVSFYRFTGRQSLSLQTLECCVISLF
jgi:hypothetical protein